MIQEASIRKSEVAGSHPGRGSLTDLAQDIWAEVLGRDSVGPSDDFFELGGHSVKAARAVARLSERLGFELPLLSIFEAPTPAEMVALIAELRTQRDRDPAVGPMSSLPEWVVPLQREGTGRPIFVFPIGHTELQALATEARIAALVGRQHPFWGLRQDHPYLERARREGTPRLAAEYIAQMRAIQGDGPFLLYGHCGGGYLAWEVARQLLAAGEKVAGILFYQVPLRPDFDQTLPGVTPANITRPVLLSLHYRPNPLPVDLSHLMTESWRDRGWWIPWQRVALGSYEPVVMPGEDELRQNASFSREETIAHHIRAWIERSEEREPGA